MMEMSIAPSGEQHAPLRAVTVSSAMVHYLTPISTAQSATISSVIIHYITPVSTTLSTEDE